MGSLDDKNVVDYGAGVPLYPFSAIGTTLGRVLSYYKGERDGSRAAKYAKFEVVESNAPDIEPGEVYALWFPLAKPDDQQVFYDRERRNFVMAAVGADVADRNFRADPEEKKLAERDFDAELTFVRIVQTEDTYVDKKTNIRKTTTRKRYAAAT